MLVPTNYQEFVAGVGAAGLPTRRHPLRPQPLVRQIGPLALGRKNYLFAGSDTGGDRAVALYTVIQTAKLNSLDPEAYLRDVLTRIADHPRIADLLPWNIREPQHRAAA